MAPKVFISHASEDKERFVIRFAEALRGAGIEAWLDKWELRPGDSLIQRIFDEGIAEAEVFIVVLSRHSVNKRWVREELDAGIVRRINHESRLIPIILDGLDDAEVPEALKATVWVKIAEPNDYRAALDEIVRAIYGHIEKPPLGTPPAYVTSPVIIPGLNRSDALVLSVLGGVALEGDHPMVDPSTVESRCKERGLSHDGYFESLLAPPACQGGPSGAAAGGGAARTVPGRCGVEPRPSRRRRPGTTGAAHSRASGS
jgi:hypothetical protein